MQPAGENGLRIFRVAGINVYLHWYWFLVAFYEINARNGKYSSIVWNILEYLALFVIVLLHEFGHALACRQVGGIADKIVLWPLGGVAYVSPPPRPGANLWSIAAGPLVNVALLPLLFGTYFYGSSAGWQLAAPDAFRWLRAVVYMNAGLLMFNVLPIYPLDGGQILRSLLWFIFGRGRSLMIATAIGFAGGIGLIGLAIWSQSIWTGIIAVYLLMNCWSSWKHAQLLLQYERTQQTNPAILSGDAQ
ncbi:MAG TPA: site-2 protease family protein [Terriglobales bacterium]|jgi:Zn-dependent protease|nr:site-2 protease family protein [Terriglobales bacterium]